MRSFLLLASLLILLPISACKEDRPPRRSSTPRVGFLAPEIHGEDTHGVEFKLSDYKGKVVLLDFGAEWCGPCQMFWPRGRNLVRKYKDRPFVLLGVNLDPEQSIAKAAFDDGKITWRSWWDGRSSAITQQWRVEGFPTFFLIDAKGVIRQHWPGLARSELEDAVRVLVKEAEEDS